MRTISYEVRCRHCHGRIVGCVGKYGDWKHKQTNSERCLGAALAEPHLVPTDAEVNRWRQQKRRQRQ